MNGASSSLAEYQEDLHEAQTTIVLQQKQIASYEKLIKKQNDKIRLLRGFIHQQHGKQQLDKVEAGQPTSSISMIEESFVTSSRRTLPSSIKSNPFTTDQQQHPKNADKDNDNDDHALIHIRLGERDMHSFFFDTTDPPPAPSCSSQWEICSSLPTNNHNTHDAPPPISALLDAKDDDTNIPAAAAEAAVPPPVSVTEISSQSSHTTDGGGMEDNDGSPFTNETTPPLPQQQKVSVIISPISNTPIARQQQQRGTNQTTAWDPSKSPTNRHHRHQQQPQPQQQQPSLALTIHHDSNQDEDEHRPLTYAQYRDRMFQSSSSSSSSLLSKQRSTLTTIDANQPSRKNYNDDGHFLKRPAPDSEFPYAEVVRKKDERAKLHGVTCACCAKYFENSTSATAPGGVEERIQKYSRHRERYKQPSTPPGFWDLDFPDSPLNG
ncbi:hypothetical protein BCR42DRAFT_99815 [Absidia repens]|uniref:DNA endonuclease activator Ctp1 C-terminal domain-containing protein n=1 Tax=Absidia repens TaxID=90262 RepID=A0A1X2I838_9FUNG|nr:hypothetical protein BCR42DRAFT_99815 [Absidia repens]